MVKRLEQLQKEKEKQEEELRELKRKHRDEEASYKRVDNHVKEIMSMLSGAVNM